MGSDKFSVGIIGCGRWGANHARTALKLWRNEVRWLCDLRSSTLDPFRPLVGTQATRFSEQPQEVFADPETKAVIIAAPAAQHYELTRAALLAGKDVLVEKPLSLQSSQARALVALAAAKSRILMVGHILLFHPAVRALKLLIDRGDLGRLQYIYSNRLNLGAVRTEENILWSFAPHDISLLLHLIGHDPMQVEAHGGVFLRPGVHDVTLTTLRFPANVQAHIHVSWLHPFKEHRMVVIGDKQMAVFEDSAVDKGRRLLLYPKGIDLVGGESVKRDGEGVPVPFGVEEPLAEELRHFAACVIERNQPLTDGASGVRVLDILERAQRCLERGQQKETVEPRRDLPSHVRVHPTAIVDDNVSIGEGTSIWHFSHIQPHSKIGRNCTIGQNVNIANNVVIGDYVKIQNNVSIYEGVELEDYVFCGPSMVFTNVLTPRCEFPQRGSEHYLPTKVGYGASLGANSTIVCGTTVGRFAFVGAGAVVTRDVPEYALVVGNPARLIGWMCRCGTRLELGKGTMTCGKCGECYELHGEVLSPILTHSGIAISK